MHLLRSSRSFPSVSSLLFKHLLPIITLLSELRLPLVFSELHCEVLSLALEFVEIASKIKSILDSLFSMIFMLSFFLVC